MIEILRYSLAIVFVVAAVVWSIVRDRELARLRKEVEITAIGHATLLQHVGTLTSQSAIVVDHLRKALARIASLEKKQPWG